MSVELCLLFFILQGEPVCTCATSQPGVFTSDKQVDAEKWSKSNLIDYVMHKEN